MSIRETLEEYDFFDQPVVEHGFTRYNRDYRLVAEIYGAAPSGPGSRLYYTYDFLFLGCVEARYRCNVRSGFSMDDVFIDYDRWLAAGEPNGFVWGVNFADQANLAYIEESEQAGIWSERLGLTMHEVEIETNTYTLNLVFHDVTVSVTPASDS